MNAMERLAREISPVELGGKGEWSNGNGSLMRSLPIPIYFRSVKDPEF